MLRRYLYALIVSMDANFRLKQQLVSSYSQDPLYGDGFAYFVPKTAFDKFVLSQTSDEDVSYSQDISVARVLIYLDR